jgi:RND family efflux transporter MFP subunit
MKQLHLAFPALLLACVGCQHTPQIPPDQAAPISAKVIQVSESSTYSGRSLEGTVAARQMADISSQIMAPIASVLVREGDSVHQGQVLIRLSSAALQATVEQSKAQLLAASRQQAAAESQEQLAAASYARYAALNERHSITPHEFDQVKAQLEAAKDTSQASAAQVAASEAALRGAEAGNTYTTIRAPFSGVITKKFVDAGAMASPGTPLLQLEDATQREVDLQVNEASLQEFHVGSPVQVLVNGSASPMAAKVRELAPSGDPAAHSFTVKIALPAVRGVYSGMTAQVLVPGAKQSLIMIPESAVLRRGQLDSVLALDGNSIAQIRYVSLGQQNGANVEVISGLIPGDKILAQPDDAFIGHRIEQQL